MLPEPLPAGIILRKKDVMRALSISRSTIDRWLREGKLIQPFVLNDIDYWKSEWIIELVARAQFEAEKNSVPNRVFERPDASSEIQDPKPPSQRKPKD